MRTSGPDNLGKKSKTGVMGGSVPIKERSAEGRLPGEMLSLVHLYINVLKQD
jgi:hypothetical protein